VLLLLGLSVHLASARTKPLLAAGPNQEPPDDVFADPVPGVLVEGPDTIRVMLSLAERLHIPWARAAIIRPAGENIRDIIVVTTETTPADLEKAVRMLLGSWESMDYPLQRELRAHVSRALQEPPPSALLDGLTRDLVRLRDAESVDIREFGMLPSLPVDLVVPEGEAAKM
jgi:hypothetical protein